MTSLIGWLAARSETVFLRRGSRGHAKVINGQIAGILGQGNYVAVFPEGTTTDGTHLLHFHAALIQPALAVATIFCIDSKSRRLKSMSCGLLVGLPRMSSRR